jgi:hypothetical protein
MTAVVYDAGVLVAADKNDRRAWAEHKARLELGFVPLVPAPVLAQVSRSPQQVQLRRFLTGCAVVPLGESEAHEAGRLLGKARTADVIDAFVVTTASAKRRRFSQPTRTTSIGLSLHPAEMSPLSRSEPPYALLVTAPKTR